MLRWGTSIATGNKAKLYFVDDMHYVAVDT